MQQNAQFKLGKLIHYGTVQHISWLSNRIISLPTEKFALTLNWFRKSRRNPRIPAYTSLEYKFDFNAMILAHPGWMFLWMKNRMRDEPGNQMVQAGVTLGPLYIITDVNTCTWISQNMNGLVIQSNYSPVIQKRPSHSLLIEPLWMLQI